MKKNERKDAASKKGSKEPHRSNSSPESGECSPSPSTSPVLANVVGDIQLDKVVHNPTYFGQTSSQDSEMTDDAGDQEVAEGLFSVDKNGSGEESMASTEMEERLSERMRNYSPFDMSKVLTEVATPPPVVQKKMVRAACFNCGGQHKLEMCDKKHDHRKIGRARTEFFNGRRSLSERYLDNNANSAIRPGKISDDLRAALGIGSRDLPEWIYRMRQKGLLDGYPPGYLKQAVETSADKLLEFYTESDAPPYSDSKKGNEEKSGPPKIVAEKMIYYFGFNYFSRQYRDRERNFRVPYFKEYVQFQQASLDEKFEAEQRSKRRNKRKRTPPEGRKKIQRQDLEEDDDVCIQPPPPVAPGFTSEDSMVTPKKKVNEQNVAAKHEMSCPNLMVGSSERAEWGTPIGRTASLRSKPALDKFGVGVVPFTHEPENTSNRGFFTKLMSKLKRAYDK